MADKPADVVASATIALYVGWADTDAAGHHHHGSVARWVEAAEASLYRDIGYPQLMTLVPRVAFHAEYLDRLYYQDAIEATVRVQSVGRTSLTYEFEVRRANDGRLAARGTYTVVHLGELQGRGTPWPDDLRAALTAADVTGS